MNPLLLIVLVVACVAEEAEYDELEYDTEDAVAESRHAPSPVKAGYGYEKVKFVDPPLWPRVFDLYCNGHTQSPIDLVADDAKKMKCDPFMFKNYNLKPDTMTIKNNGHTAVVTVMMDKMPTVSGGCLNYTYTFAQMHWHWGKTDTKGSEHRMKGVMAPLELHLVHYNSDDFDDLSAAIASGSSNALAVLGVMVEIGDKSAGQPYPYDRIAAKLKKIKNYDTSTKLSPGIKLKSFLPIKPDAFFRYMGSLTTPTCNEIVEWTVFKKPTNILKKDLLFFRKLYDSYGNMLVNNFRPPQNLYGRTVYKS